MKKDESLRNFAKKNGWKLYFGKWSYWDNVPYFELENGKEIYLCYDVVNEIYHNETIYTCLNLDISKKELKEKIEFISAIMNKENFDSANLGNVTIYSNRKSTKTDFYEMF